MDTFYHEVFETDESHPIQLLLHRGEVNFVVLEHWHKDLELNYFLESDAFTDLGSYIWVNGKKIFASPGSITLINSCDIHALEPTGTFENTQDQILAASLIISHDFMKTVCPDVDNLTFVLEGNEEQLGRLKSLFRQMIALNKDGEKEFLYLRTIAIALEMTYILLTYFARQKNKGMLRSQKYLDRLAKVMDYMKQHYQEPLTLHGVAEQFSVSEQYLSRTFKTYTGRTFKQYLSQIRLAKAYYDVIQSEYSMIEIAMRSGFSDIRSFIGVFKAAYGMPPMQYRKEYAGRRGLESPPMQSSKPFVRTLEA